MIAVSLTMAFREMIGERFNDSISERTIDYEKAFGPHCVKFNLERRLRAQNQRKEIRFKNKILIRHWEIGPDNEEDSLIDKKNDKETGIVFSKEMNQRLYTWKWIENELARHLVTEQRGTHSGGRFSENSASDKCDNDVS